MRASFVVGVVLVLGAVGAGAAACLPDPGQDFDDYADRTASLAPAPAPDAGPVDAAPPPTEAIEGLYYGACRSQLAFGRADRVFNFYTKTTFTPLPAGGGTMTLSLQSLKFDPATIGPPATVSSAGVTGPVQSSITPSTPNVDPTGVFTLQFGTVTVPGDANPITQRDVVIENTALKGHLATQTFCAQLTGKVVQPIQLDLDPTLNTCLFEAVKDGDATRMFTKEEFDKGCP